jgi:flagellar motor switch protein FliM
MILEKIVLKLSSQHQRKEKAKDGNDKQNLEQYLRQSPIAPTTNYP